jgi:hypothetical protein
MRAIASVGPPAANGTMTVIGFVRIVRLRTKNGWHAKCACQTERDGAAVKNSGRHEEILPSVDRFVLIVFYRLM